MHNLGTKKSSNRPKLSINLTNLTHPTHPTNPTHREKPLLTPLQTPKTEALTPNLKEKIQSFVGQLKSNAIQVLSIDFDGTLTGNSTFEADIGDDNLMSFFGESKEKQEGQISFINYLFSECKKNNIECVVTSRSKTYDLTRILKAITSENMPKIIGGDMLVGYDGAVTSGSKAQTLHRDFKDKKILHIDDNVGEKSGFAEDEFRHVKSGSYFSLKPAFSLETLEEIFKNKTQNQGISVQ
jgi:hypothetical protein